jgi:hypothetical protein
MNKILTAALILISQTVLAQNISITEQNVLFLNGQQPALVSTIYNNSLNEVMDKWKSYMKSFKNEKVKSDKGEIFADNIMIKEWGNNTVDIYARLEENKGDKSVKIMVAFDLGGAYLTSASDAGKYAYAEKMIRDFAVETSKAPLVANLKDAEKALSKMEGDRDGFEKSIKSLKGDIESYKEKIKKAEEDIQKNETELGKKKSEIDAQRTAIQLLNSKIGEVR